MNSKTITYIATLLAPFLLIINQGLGSQSDPISVFGIDISQIINWIVILSFVIVCRNTFKQSYLFLFFCIGLVFSKILNVFLPENIIFYGSYKFFLLSITFIGGIIYLNNHYKLVHKQLIFICFINAIMMFLQLSNAGEWTQFLSTESTEAFGQKIMYDTLFVPIEQLDYNVIQGRPSGLLRSNNILSGVTIFALAIHLTRLKKNNLFGIIVLTLMMVLASARLIYISYFFMFLFLFFSSNKQLRSNAIKSLISTLFFIFMYSILFPGLFDNFWNFYSLTYNLLIRINDIVANIQISFINDFLSSILYLTPKADWDLTGSVLSSFSLFIRYLEFFFIFGISSLIIIIYSRKKFLKLKPEFKYVSLFCLMNLVLYAAAVIVLLDQFYWFTAGFALCSLSYYFPNSYLKRLNINKKIQ